MELRPASWPFLTAAAFVLIGSTLALLAPDERSAFGWAVAVGGAIGLIVAGLCRWLATSGYLDLKAGELFLDGYAYWDDGLRVSVVSMTAVQRLHFLMADPETGIPSSVFQINIVHSNGRTLARTTGDAFDADAISTELSEFLQLPMIRTEPPNAREGK